MIKDYDFIFFDCMETLVDLHKLPTMKDYAMWAYDGSGVESLWQNFNTFFNSYTAARQELAASLPEHAEFEMKGRFLHTVRSSVPTLPDGHIEAAADKLYKNYWKNYKAGCYVSEDVKKILCNLEGSVRMGVVSNFMVMGGIEELLDILKIRKFFTFVVTSVAVGKRKPHPEIYNVAVGISGVSADRIMFIGDDFVNDYIAPISLGMKAAYYDKHDQHSDAKLKFTNFNELLSTLAAHS